MWATSLTPKVRPPLSADPGIWARGLEFIRESMEGLDRLPERGSPEESTPETNLAAEFLSRTGFELDPDKSGGVLRMAPLDRDEPRWKEFARPTAVPGQGSSLSSSFGLGPIALECRFERGDGPFKVVRRAMFVGGARFSDAEASPLENVRYQVLANGHPVMDALSGAGGYADVLPFGDPLPLGSLVYSDIHIDCPPEVAFISILYLCIPDAREYGHVMLERGVQYPILPRRRMFMSDGMLWTAKYSDRNQGPPPDRGFYHRSRHPPEACKSLLCHEPTAALCACRLELAADLAAKKIQRAVLHMLYAPDAGPLFLKAKSRFARRAKIK